MVERVQELLPDHSAQLSVQILEGSAQERLGDLSRLIDQGAIEAVIAAGQGAQWLRSRLGVPVAVVAVNGYDLLRALARARQLRPKAVILSRRRLAEELDAIRPLLNLAVTQRIYDTDEEARLLLGALAKEAQPPVVVGSSLIVQLAAEVNLPSVLVYSAESIAQAFDAACELVRVARLEAARRERVDRMLESLAEGVVAVDMQERVQSINPALARLMGVMPERAHGQVLSVLAPALSLEEVLRDGEARRDEVAVLHGRTLVMQRLPLVESGEQVGAVLTLQESVAIERADRKLRAEARKSHFQARYRIDDVVGDSPVMQSAKDKARIFAASEASVLILGASGTGKELFAQGIHLASRRAGAAFVALNCAAFPDNLLESELFGYEEGAFTGSKRGGKPGLIELAHRGTLFLDEIGDMPLVLQTRLLRVLQEREVLRLGGAEPVPVNVRVIAATHADLKAAIAAQRFRADLYYRLAILTLSLPPLAARGEDVLRIATRLAHQALHATGRSAQAEPLALALCQASQAYVWPGNVRELHNLVERLAVFLLARGQLGVADILELAPELAAARSEPVGGAPENRGGPALPRQQWRREQALQVLAACGGDRDAAAAKLGVSRTTLWRLTRPS